MPKKAKQWTFLFGAEGAVLFLWKLNQVSVHFSACHALWVQFLHPDPGFMECHIFSMFLNKN